MWRKKLSYDKTWAGFKKFFAEEYNNTRELQHINTNQTWFHGANMAITIQDEIFEALENLDIATISEKYVLTQLTRTIKQLTETSKILMKQIKTLPKKNARFTSNGGHQQKQGGHTTIGNDYKSKLYPTGYFRTHIYKFVKGHTSATCRRRNDGKWAHGKINQI